MDIIKNCKICGKTYVGHSMASLYCSDACRRIVDHARKRQNCHFPRENEAGTCHIPDGINATKTIVHVTGEYLNLDELAILLRVSHTTAYRYVSSGKIKGTKIGRNIIVRKTDLDSVFEDAPIYKKRKYAHNEDISLYYTTKEIVEKYHICKKAVLARCDRFNIPKEYVGRNVFFNRADVDLHFAELSEDINLSNYYTMDQLMAKFNMTKSNMLSFVYHHQIPRITRGRTVYYSRVHIDTFKRKGESVDVNWYSYAEIMEKYRLTKDQISYYIKHDNLKTEKRGKFTMIYRSDFDEKVVKVRFANAERDEEGKLVIPSQDIEIPESTPSHPKERIPETPEGYYSAEDISKKYAIRIKLVNKLGREHRLPKICLKHYNFFEKASVDELLSKRNQHPDVKEWISSVQMQDIYSMTGDACRSFIHRHKVPTKVEYGETYYSKDHIDRIKGLVFDGMENYYSVAGVMKKYNMSRDRVFYYVKQYKVSKTKCGQFVFFLKTEFDNVMKKCLLESRK